MVRSKQVVFLNARNIPQGVGEEKEEKLEAYSQGFWFSSEGIIIQVNFLKSEREQGLSYFRCVLNIFIKKGAWVEVGSKNEGQKLKQ